MTGHLSTGRRLAALAIAAAAAVSLAACSSSGGTGTTSTPKTSSSASAATAVQAVPKCKAGDDETKALKLGAFLPLTGGLAFLGPASVGGVDLALNDINAAGGVLGTDACINLADSSETAQAALSVANIKKQLASKVSAIVGPESSGVTANVLPTINGAKTVLFSNAATADDLSGVSPWFFRNPAPNGFEAVPLGNQVVADGHTKVAFLTFNDPYGLNLRDGIEKTIAAGGAKVVYGGKGKNQEFPSTETNFGSDVSSALATKPDAIVLITFDQAAAVVKALKSAGWDLKNTYYVDGNLTDYSADLPANTLTGGKGTTQGVNPSPSLRSQVSAAYKANGGSKDITSYGYAAEAYDATTLIALAAEKAKSASSENIRKNLPAVSGTTGGQLCKSYKACKALVDAGKEIQYQGFAGTGPFNAKRDVSSGYISLYQYVGDAPSKFLQSSKQSD